MPISQGTLPEPKWSEKPIVIIVGDAPDTEEYRALYSFLRERILADEIEVVWVNHRKISDSPRFFAGRDAIRDFGSKPIMDFFVPPLDFSFSDTHNPGVERLRDDPSLKKLSSTAAIANPLTIVIGLHESTTVRFRDLWIDLPGSYDDGRQLTSCLHAPDGYFFLGPAIDTLAGGHLASRGAYAYLESSPTLLSEETRNALMETVDFLKFTIQPNYRSRPPSSLMRDQIVTVTSEFEVLTRGRSEIRNHASRDHLDPLIVSEVLDHLMRAKISFSFQGKNTGSNKTVRPAKGLATTEIAIHFLSEHLQKAREKKLEIARGGIDPKELPPKLRRELALLEAEIERTQTKLKELRRTLADETANGKQVLLNLETEIVDLEASLAEKRSQFESELDALRREAEAEIAERHASLNQDREELKRHQVKFHDEKARFGERVTDISVKRTLAIGYVARDLHRFQNPLNAVTKRMILGFIPWTTTEIEDSESALQHSINVETEYRDAIQTVAMMIREHPEKPVNLYDATFYFIAQRAIAVAQLDVAPILRTDAIATARMLKISYDAAPQNEREWFASLDRDKVIPEDTAHEMMVYLVEAAITNRFDGQLTMAELAAVLERITVDDDVLVLPEGTPNDIDVLSSTLPAVNAPAHVIEAAGVETPTPDSPAPPLR